MPREKTSYEVIVANDFLLNGNEYEYKLTFSDKEKAIAACKKIIDDFLAQHCKKGMSSEQLNNLYSVFSEHPWVFSSAESDIFDEYKYIAGRCKELCTGAGDARVAEQEVLSILSHYDEPILALVLNEKSQSADDVHADIYVINATDHAFEIMTKSDFFQTVNEETGDVISVGPKPHTMTLKPHTVEKVGDIIEWELDFALGFDVAYKRPGEKQFTYLGANLKSGRSFTITLPVLNKRGGIVRLHQYKKE